MFTKVGYGILVCSVLSIAGVCDFRLGFAQEKSSSAATAEPPNAGQSKLDEATDLKLEADTIDKLAKVIDLCSQALAEGLDESNTAFAKELLSSSAFQRAQLTMQELMRSRLGPQAMRRTRTKVMDDLKLAIENDPKMIDAYLMLARLHAVGMERKEALDVLQAAIDQGSDDKRKVAEAYMVRAQLHEDIEDKIKDLQKATEVDPTNVEAWQGRIALLIGQGKFEDAYESIQKLRERDPTNNFAVMAAVQALVSMERNDEALELLSKQIESDPESADWYRMRARLHAAKKDQDAALADLNVALEKNEQDVESLMMRAEIHLNREEIEQAQQDVDDALLLQPNLSAGVLFRSLIAARQKRYDDAIRDMQMLVRADPNNPAFLLQLAGYYQMADRPNQSIKVLDEVLQKDPNNWRALRLRGDSLLSLGEHKRAIDDFEKALEIISEDDDEDRSGLLNNLAWVLATSPTDELRDGKRSIALGTEACELTDYNLPHILSTLAAGYAEVGNFEEAIKWASKAVELGTETENEQLDQLQKELESYKQGKPWREKQDTKEKKAQPLTTGGVDT